MISTYQRLKRQRDAGEINGFTLIELLIVIVVLGILAAVVIFALGGITGKSAVASCQADGATVSTAMAAFTAQNPSVTPSPTLLTGNTDGGPYIQSWPNNYPHYAFQITGTGAGTLEVSTGNTYAAGPPAVYTAVVAGQLNATTPAADVPGSTSAPWLTYAGPVTCTGVS